MDMAAGLQKKLGSTTREPLKARANVVCEEIDGASARFLSVASRRSPVAVDG
jgi:hypothetical protein